MVTKARREFLRLTAGAAIAGLYSGTSAAGDQQTPAEAWRYRTGGLIDSSPTVVGGTVYVGSDDGRLYALEKVSGEKRWAFQPAPQANNWIETAPTVIDGTIYAIETELDGSSDGSRVRLGTLGHHDEWSNLAGAFAEPVRQSDDGSSPSRYTMAGAFAGVSAALGAAAYAVKRYRLTPSSE